MEILKSKDKRRHEKGRERIDECLETREMKDKSLREELAERLEGIRRRGNEE
jgi:hypothetical protein